MTNGLITNYKFYETLVNSEDSGHYYEISCEDNDKICFYAKSLEGIPVEFGTEVKIDINSNSVWISGNRLPILGPFEKLHNVVNYHGFVVDCLDSDIGVYNLDNEIFLFGSACLDLPIGVGVTLFNLHLMRLIDSNWIFRLFGSILKRSTHILVYCPAFSSYLEGTDNVSYDNLISTNSNLMALIYANNWLKNTFQFDFPGFQSLDQLGTILFPENHCKGAQFIGHCEKCAFIDNFCDFSESLQKKTLFTARNLKETFIKIKDELQSANSYNNQTLNHTFWLRNELVYGTIKRKNSVLFEVSSGEKSISVYCNDSAFSPEDDSFIVIFNSLQIFELVPKLRIIDSWSAKAYLWISPETKIWSPSGYFWSTSVVHEKNGSVLCKIVRKYLIQKEIQYLQHEITVIHVESEKGPHCFYLNPMEKYYGILSGDSGGILALRYWIDESFFEVSDEPLFLPSTAILPTLTCTLTVDSKQGPLQVLVNDIPYLSQVKGLQFFSLKLRTYSISSLFIKLICSKCRSQVEAGKCLGHFENFSPVLIISAVIETSDMDGTRCNILIDQFSHLEMIFGTIKSPSFSSNLISLLKSAGKLKLSADNFSFTKYFKQENAEQQSLESSVEQLFPVVSRVINCTFPVTAASSVLKPINLEICDPKIELINILKLF